MNQSSAWLTCVTMPVAESELPSPKLIAGVSVNGEFSAGHEPAVTPHTAGTFVFGYVQRCAYLMLNITVPGVAVGTHVMVTPRRCVASASVAANAIPKTAMIV